LTRTLYEVNTTIILHSNEILKDIINFELQRIQQNLLIRINSVPYFVVLENMCTVPRTRHNCTAGQQNLHIGGEFKYTVADNFAYPAGGTPTTLMSKVISRCSIRSLLCIFKRVSASHGQIRHCSQLLEVLPQHGTIRRFDDSAWVSHKKLAPLDLRHLSYKLAAHDVGGYVVDGRKYFWEIPPKNTTVKSDTACCYHMGSNRWKNMDSVHAALYSTG
jgi:hypothetical protein